MIFGPEKRLHNIFNREDHAAPARRQSNTRIGVYMHKSFFSLVLYLIPFILTAQELTPADYVNALKGTAPLEDLSLYGGPNYDPEPNSMGFSGCVYPGPTAPHGMVHMSPINELNTSPGIDPTRYGSGYFYPDNTIMGFTHTNKGHWSGGNLLFMATVGELQTTPSNASNPDGGYRSRFSHDNEIATAGYYFVHLQDYGIDVELSALKYTAFHKYTFPATPQANILIDLSRSHGNISNASVEVIDDTHIRGTQNSYSFYAEFSKPFDSYGTWEGSSINSGSNSASGGNIGFYVTYTTTAGETVEVKMGMSRSNTEQAQANMQAEAADMDFAAGVAAAKQLWNDILGRIEIEGGTEEQRSIFYSSLYRSLLWPPVTTDHSAGERGFEIPPLWDTFRNKQPLVTLLEPEVKEDILRVLVDRAESRGWMDTYFHGNHASAIITDSYLSGIDFDVETAYTYLKKNQTDPSGPLQYLDEYLNRGYVSTEDSPPSWPREPGKSAVAKTLEYAFNDGCMAILADALGKQEDLQDFIDGSKKYSNVFDPSTGFMWGRRANGDFITPFYPMEPYHTYMYREASSWQYTWFVPHDIPGLAELMGGREAFAAKLDEFFNTPFEPNGTLIDVAGMVGQYAHSNQPDHHTPYLYNYAGQPWKTQEVVRTIMELMYQGVVYTGMDDCGEHSAWYVWSAMGLYPMCPPHLVYPIGSPLFDRVTMHLPDFKYGGKDFVIEANNVSDANMYIQSATLNGVPYDKPWISFWEIAGGSTLTLEMGPEPSTWGSALENAPPSEPVSITYDKHIFPAGIYKTGSIRVYDLKGHLVNEIVPNGKEITWNGLDKSGNKVPAGIYIAVQNGRQDRPAFTITR
jgi:predicted alpha-1,2-mannosidase